MTGIRFMLRRNSVSIVPAALILTTAYLANVSAYADGGSPPVAGSVPTEVAALPLEPAVDMVDVPVATSSKADAGKSVAAKMSSVERVYIRVPGLAALTGEYRVNGDGTMALPGIGRLDVGDATIAEFESQLASEIQRVSSRESSVAVEVIDYRPVFVSGVVSRAGAFPWKPGFSVLHAETLAGGLFRGAVATDASLVEPTTDREQERAVRSAFGLAATVASIERLRMELREETSYVLPPRVQALVSKADQQTLFSAQEATLKSRLSVFKSKSAAAASAKSMAEREKVAFEEQRVRILEQLKQRRQLVQKIQQMTEHRYARGETLFEEQVKVAELEERLTTTTLAISKAEVASNTAEQELQTLVLTRKADIDSEVLALEQKRVQFELDIESANNVYRRATGHDVVTSRLSEPLIARYEIVRSEGGASRVLKADRSTPVLPGDVVVVSFGRPDAS